jgi:hypothetical protein
MIRPSDSSTVSVALVTLTLVAKTDCFSMSEELIPFLQQMIDLLLDYLVNRVDFMTRKSIASFQANRRKPKLGLRIISFDVDMRGFAAIACIKEESIRTRPKHRRHVNMLHCCEVVINCVDCYLSSPPAF